MLPCYNIRIRGTIYMYVTKKTNRKQRNKKLIIIITIILFLIISTVAIMFIYKANQPTKTINNSSTDSSTPTNSGNTDTNGSTSTSPDTSTTTPAIDSSITPREPTGTFVSNHSPNISGSPAPNIESSTCTTTPGASCTIQFTNGDIIKSLDVKTTDSNGNATWDSWTLSEIGLTQGSWVISAIATNGSKTATATDATTLSVEQ